MLDKLKQPQHVRQVSGNIPIYHRYTLGVAGERFFKAFRDQQQILASPCPKCHDRLLPPKMYCERCFEETSDDWAALGGGRLHPQLYGLTLLAGRRAVGGGRGSGAHRLATGTRRNHSPHQGDGTGRGVPRDEGRAGYGLRSGPELCPISAISGRWGRTAQ